MRIYSELRDITTGVSSIMASKRFVLFFTVACLLVSIEAQSSESTAETTAESTTPSAGTKGTTTSKKEDATPAAAAAGAPTKGPSTNAAAGTTSNPDKATTTTTKKPHKHDWVGQLQWIPLGQLIMNKWNSKFGRPNNNNQHSQVIG